jgi:hypothetical protein
MLGTPTISAGEAVQIAIDTRVGPTVAAQATGVSRHFALFGDDDYPGAPSGGHSRCSLVADASSERHCSLARVPAWVVTFEGVNYPLSGPSSAGTAFAHEVHVVIDAQTGNDIELFAYR